MKTKNKKKTIKDYNELRISLVDKFNYQNPRWHANLEIKLREKEVKKGIK